ncbi:MAG: hypothetical protein Q8Q76_10905 [Methylotenera sp.]|nr:hypothetical protein [Methylotenera sp.]
MFKFFEDPALRTSKSEVGKLGVSTALDPQLANEFANRAGTDGSNVMPLLHRMTKGAKVELSPDVRSDQVWATVLDAYKDNYDALKFNSFTSNKLKTQEVILQKNHKCTHNSGYSIDGVWLNLRSGEG